MAALLQFAAVFLWFAVVSSSPVRRQKEQNGAPMTPKAEELAKMQHDFEAREQQTQEEEAGQSQAKEELKKIQEQQKALQAEKEELEGQKMEFAELRMEKEELESQRKSIQLEKAAVEAQMMQLAGLKDQKENEESEWSLLTDPAEGLSSSLNSSENSQCKLYQNVMFLDEPDDQHRVRGVGECSVLCAWHSDCAFFSYHHKYGTCYFYKKDHKITQEVLTKNSNACCDSGTPCSVAEMQAPYKETADTIKRRIKTLKKQLVDTVRGPGGSYEKFVKNQQLKKDLAAAGAEGDQMKEQAPSEGSDELKARLEQAKSSKSTLAWANVLIVCILSLAIAGSFASDIKKLLSNPAKA